MLVASENEVGEPKRLTQAQLAARSGVARSTIAKYSAPGDSNAINPDLSTICRLADSLNVAPAFLLLRPEDWSHLAQSATYFASAMNDPKFVKVVQDLSQSRRVSAGETSEAGLLLAELFGLYSEQPNRSGSSQLELEIQAKRAKTKMGVLAMSALPPMGKLPHDSLIPLLAICAILGAHLN
ncbi:MAG TPA: helix-turn-helix transcriptional regulator [Methylotenera sp.]